MQYRKLDTKEACLTVILSVYPDRTDLKRAHYNRLYAIAKGIQTRHENTMLKWIWINDNTVIMDRREKDRRSGDDRRKER